MKTSTTTHLQLEKLDRVALEHLREALPYYTRLTDIAVNGTPLSNPDAIVQVVCAQQCCRDGLGVFNSRFRFAGCPFIAFVLIAVSSSGCNFPCLGKQWMLCSVEVLHLSNPPRNILPKRRLLSFFGCCGCCCGGGAGCMEPRPGTMMLLHCFEVELGIYKWRIADCTMQQQSLQKRCWIRQHGHSSAWICDVTVSQVSELVCLAYLPPQNEFYGFNWGHFWLCFWGTKHRIVSEIVTSCSISVKFIRWGIADLGPLLDVMQQRPDLVIEMNPQSLGEAGSAESAVSAECSARGSEWRAHKAAWGHSFVKKWRLEGYQFTKHHAPSLYTINHPQKFRSPGHIISLGSVTMLHVSAY